MVKNPRAMQETEFDPWVGKISRRRERLATPVFWPGEFQGLYSPWGHKESDATEFSYEGNESESESLSVMSNPL